MGLDMYLYRKTYVQNWDHNTDKYQVTVTKNGQPTSINPERTVYVIEEAAYWRKANSIHKWFVDNVQSGKDDCGEYYVSLKNMEELLKACVSGCFFGGTEYDDNYLYALSHTVEILKATIASYDSDEKGNSSYYYHSSW